VRSIVRVSMARERREVGTASHLSKYTGEDCFGIVGSFQDSSSPGFAVCQDIIRWCLVYLNERVSFDQHSDRGRTMLF
jgi:hypothetical protein